MAEPEHQTPAPAEQAIRAPGGGPSLVPVPFRAADGLVAFLAAADVERRADVTLAMQRTSGNRAVTRMLQRDPLDDVKKVRSFEVEEKQAGQATLQKQLDRRLQKRRDEITAALAETKNEARKTALSHDLAKTLDDIIKTPDAKGINPELRADIIESATRLGKATATAQSAQQAWSQFDDVFADADVEKTLAGIGLTPADLKALIARESGDLVQNPQGPGIAGIAQIGVDEEKRAGGSPGDRKQPRLAIPLAAKVLVDTAADLKKALKTVPKGDDWKKFLFAAYNAGVFAIAAAQAAAETGDTWADLVKGGESSPLFTGLKKFYGSKAKTKFSEVMNHVNGIFARLAPAP
jgi:soluble lytic murein transglycosylase-like protein